jgi:hypothetical protein
MSRHELIEIYLLDLRGLLPADVVDELTDGLIETYERFRSRGLNPTTQHSPLSPTSARPVTSSPPSPRSHPAGAPPAPCWPPDRCSAGAGRSRSRPGMPGAGPSPSPPAWSSAPCC